MPRSASNQNAEQRQIAASRSRAVRKCEATSVWPVASILTVTRALTARALQWVVQIDNLIVCQSITSFPNRPFRGHEKALENITVFKGLSWLRG